MSIDCVSAGIGYPCGFDMAFSNSYFIIPVLAIIGGIILFLYFSYIYKKEKVVEE